MAERFEIVEKALLAMLEDRKYATLRDILVTMNPSDIAGLFDGLEEKQIPVWIRHVMVPGVTDDPEALTRLGAFIGTLDNVKALDVLPYHVMGKVKYKELGIPYPLEGVEPATKEQAARARQIILEAYRRVRFGKA